jgi:hypothetical protein
MTEVRRRKDCGNSPKNPLLQDLAIALARVDVSRIVELVTSDVRWLPAGRKPVFRVDAFCKATTRYGPATVLTIEHVISKSWRG